MNSQLEIHPWKVFIPENARGIIIGTFPTPVGNRSFDFFYPNPRNYFWRTLMTVSGDTLLHHEGQQAINERKDLLTKLRFGITDMGHKVLRFENSASDSKIKVEEYMDILEILRSNPLITTIILTSSSGKNSAKAWFIDYLRSKDSSFAFGLKEKFCRHSILGRVMEIKVVPSPSPRYANEKTIDGIVELYKDALTYGHIKNDAGN